MLYTLLSLADDLLEEVIFIERISNATATEAATTDEAFANLCISLLESGKTKELQFCLIYVRNKLQVKIQ